MAGVWCNKRVQASAVAGPTTAILVNCAFSAQSVRSALSACEPFAHNTHRCCARQHQPIKFMLHQLSQRRVQRSPIFWRHMGNHGVKHRLGTQFAQAGRQAIAPPDGAGDDHAQALQWLAHDARMRSAAEAGAGLQLGVGHAMPCCCSCHAVTRPAMPPPTIAMVASDELSIDRGDYHADL